MADELPGEAELSWRSKRDRRDAEGRDKGSLSNSVFEGGGLDR